MRSRARSSGPAGDVVEVGQLVGREGEQASIDGLVRDARAGFGSGLVISGEPGIGKTALLEEAAARAGGMRVLRTRGVEPERAIGYASLHRLLLPVMADVEALPALQARALRVALGQAEGVTPDRFLVALAVLSLLAEAAAEQPVLCLVDDAQWADRASLDALAFAARRLDGEPVAVVFAVRPGDETQAALAGLRELALVGLDDGAAGLLLDRHGGGGLSPVQRRQVLTVSRGNPLALRELPRAVAHGHSVQGPVPLTEGLRAAFLDRVRRLDGATQRLLLLVAADGSGRVDTIRAAAGAMGLDAGALTDGRLERFVTLDGERVAFSHPLVRAAVYSHAPRDERRAVHRGLAAVLADVPRELHRYAWHLGLAAEGCDEDAARHLERSAGEASRRAGSAAAAAALERAADLSGSEPARGRRLVAAARASWQGGDVRHAGELLERADRISELPEDARLDLVETRARLDLFAGTPSDALAPLRSVIAHAVERGAERAMHLLMTYGEVGYRANRPGTWGEIAAWLERLPLDGDTPDDALYRMLYVACRARLGQEAAMRAGDIEALEKLDDPVKLAHASGLTWAVGAYELGHVLRRKAIQRARATGAAGALAWALHHQVYDELTRSRFDIAEAYLEEAGQLAMETGQVNTACKHRSFRACLAAVQGRHDEAREWADEVLIEASERHLPECLALAQYTLGHVALVSGAYDQAIVHYEAMDPARGANGQVGVLLDRMPEMVEALARAGLADRAAERTEHFIQWTGQTASPELQALAARCRALLASGDEATREYRRSVDLHRLSDTPMEQARTELLFGEHLRRMRRRAEAREQLQAAAMTFGRVGARAWAQRAHDELRAAGGAVSDAEPSILSTLTPQERRVALAISEGATNREVAAQLFLSPRTIDYHLRKIFQKTGIRSRGELIRLVLTTGDTE